MPTPTQTAAPPDLDSLRGALADLCAERDRLPDDIAAARDAADATTWLRLQGREEHIGAEIEAAELAMLTAEHEAVWPEIERLYAETDEAEDAAVDAHGALTRLHRDRVDLPRDIDPEARRRHAAWHMDIADAEEASEKAWAAKREVDAALTDALRDDAEREGRIIALGGDPDRERRDRFAAERQARKAPPPAPPPPDPRRHERPMTVTGDMAGPVTLTDARALARASRNSEIKTTESWRRIR